MGTRILNRDYTPASVQVTHLYAVAQERYVNKRNPFLIKNISDETIEAKIYPAAMLEDSSITPITTVLQPGWNPELVIGIECSEYEALQYGY
jgi:hypothetical protein